MLDENQKSGQTEFEFARAMDRQVVVFADVESAEREIRLVAFSEHQRRARVGHTRKRERMGRVWVL